MNIELSNTVEEQLRALAIRQRRAITVLVEEAIQEYLVAAAITDLTMAEIAETQVALLPELRGETDIKYSAAGG